MRLMETNHWGDTPAGQFLDLFNQWERSNGINNLGIEIEMGRDSDDQVYLDNLWVPSAIRYKGWGGKVMKAMCHAADQIGVKLRCQPLWQDDEEEPQLNLWRFYTQFGFEQQGHEFIRDPEMA